MPTKKKSKKEPSRLKKTASKKTSIKKKAAKKKAAPRKVARGAVRGKSQRITTVSYESTGQTARSGGQSGSLQGLSDVAQADSESVDELLEEGNTLEAEAVEGVEDAADPDASEVKTREVPEDDVPGEYVNPD